MGKLKFFYLLNKSPCNLRNFFIRNSSQARPNRQRRTMPLAKDLLHPSIEEEKGKCKLKRLVQSPNSYFMDVKCPGCYKITTVFSHAQTVVLCTESQLLLYGCQVPRMLQDHHGVQSCTNCCSLYRVPTPTLWMSSAQDATRSPRCSVMHKLLLFVLGAQLCYASQLVERLG